MPVLFFGMCSHWLKHRARTAKACRHSFAALRQTFLHASKKHCGKSLISPKCQSRSLNELYLYIAEAKSVPLIYHVIVSVLSFCTAHGRVALYLTMGRHFTPSPSKNPLPLEMCTPSNTWFLGSTQISISIGSEVFAGLTHETTERWTDRQTSTTQLCVAIGRYR